jgi:hypothetical protein
MYSEKDLAMYLKLILDEYAENLDKKKLLRQLNIKEVHLKRRGGLPKEFILLRRLV